MTVEAQHMVTGKSRISPRKPLGSDAGGITLYVSESAVVNLGQFPFLPKSVYGRTLKRISLDVDGKRLLSFHTPVSATADDQIEMMFRHVAGLLRRSPGTPWPLSRSPGEFGPSDLAFLDSIGSSHRVTPETRGEIIDSFAGFHRLRGDSPEETVRNIREMAQAMHNLATDREIRELHGDIRTVWPEDVTAAEIIHMEPDEVREVGLPEICMQLLRGIMSDLLGVNPRKGARGAWPSCISVDTGTVYRSYVSAFMSKIVDVPEPPNYANFGVIVP
jgi:hypothetical protein